MNSDPPLIGLLNASSIVPYRFSLERPLTWISRTFLQYIFKCKPIHSNQYVCTMQLSKIPVDKTGLQHTQQEFVIEHKIYLIKHTEFKWIWYCERLDKTILLNPPICLACIYSEVSRRWKLSGTYRQINSLFTLNQFGEGLGLLASMLADNHVVEFYCDKPALEIYSTCYGKAVAYSSAFDSIGEKGEEEEDGGEKQDLENPKESILQQWRDAVKNQSMPQGTH